MSSYLPPVHKVPRDPEDSRFVHCFHPHQVKEYVDFFNEFGFVVVRDVFSNKECQDTIDDIWNYLETVGWTTSALKPPTIKRNDPATWQNPTWPGMMGEGILGSPSVFTLQAIKNRQNANAYEVFANLYGRKDLLVNHDRYGLFRPTEGVIVNGTPQNFPAWKTHRNIHIDMNPWMYIEAPNSDHSEKALGQLRYEHSSDFIDENNEVGCLKDNQLHLQGLINLADNFEKDGGFHIVPGFKQHLVEWANSTPNMRNRYGTQNTFIVLMGNDPLNKQTLRITARAGSLVVWDQRTIHGSDSNFTDKPRYAQFVKYFPASPIDPARKQARKKSVEEKLAKVKLNEKNGLTDLGEKLFGQKEW